MKDGKEDPEIDQEKKENQSTPEKPKREWWEIPARCAVLFVIIPVFFPLQWYRAMYIYTIGRLFPVTVESKMADVEPAVLKRIPIKKMPTELKILVLKQEKQVELWGKFTDGTWKKLSFYAILAIAPQPGPKTRNDDKKTPEGIYDVKSINLNSPLYMTINLDFPSEADIMIAKQEGRDVKAMNKEFMLHGIAFSKDNVTLPNAALDDMFYMLTKVGLKNAKILIAPFDFRKEGLPETAVTDWAMERYKQMNDEMKPLKEEKEKTDDAETGEN